MLTKPLAIALRKKRNKVSKILKKIRKTLAISSTWMVIRKNIWQIVVLSSQSQKTNSSFNDFYINNC